MRARSNRKETVLRHASPPSKKRKPAKMGCSSFGFVGLSVSCVAFISFARWCVFCRHVVVRLWRSAFVDLIGDAWRCHLAGHLMRTSQGARLLLLDESQRSPAKHSRRLQEGDAPC